MTLEDSLLEALVDKYTAKGVNLQKILDNSLFQQLPLNRKIAFIEKAGSPISSSTPTLNKSTLLTGAIGGGAAGLISTALAGVAGLPVHQRAPALILGSVMGAGLGGVTALYRARADRDRDLSTLRNARTSGLSALIDRSGSRAIAGSPFGVNRYLDMLEGMVGNTVPGISVQSASQIPAI